MPRAASGAGAARPGRRLRDRARTAGAAPGGRPRRWRHGRRRDHGVVGQDLHEGPAGRRAGAARADGRAARLVQQRDRRAGHGPRRRHRRPGTSSSRWAPAASATSPTCAGSRRRGSASCSTSAPRTPASSARRRPPRGPRASWSRRCPPDGVAVLNADDPLVAAMAARTAARVVRVGLAADADVRAAHVSLDAAGTPDVRAAGRRHGRRRDAAAARRAPGRQRSRRRRGGPRAGRDRRRGRRGAGHRDPAQQVADGGHRAAGRRDRRQRRLQRQPRLHARPRSPRWPRWRRGRRSWAVLGEMLELGAASASEHEAAGRLAVRSGVAAGRRRGRGRRTGACRSPRRGCRRGRGDRGRAGRRLPHSPCCGPRCAPATSCW